MGTIERPSAYGSCTFKPVVREASLWPIGCPELAEGCRKPTGRTPALQVRGVPVRRWCPRNSPAPTDCFLAVLRTPTPGHFRSYDQSGNRHVNDRFQSTAAIGGRRLEGTLSPERSPTVLWLWSTSDACGTSAVRPAELELPTLCSPTLHRRERRRCIAGGHRCAALATTAHGALRPARQTSMRRLRQAKPSRPDVRRRHGTGAGVSDSDPARWRARDPARPRSASGPPCTA